jgi:hypothetical protein
MALTESQDTKLEIAGNGTVFVETTTRIMRDGVEIASTLNRTSYEPGSDVSKLPQNVQDICAAVWTQEVITAFQDSIQKSV